MRPEEGSTRHSHGEAANVAHKIPLLALLLIAAASAIACAVPNDKQSDQKTQLAVAPANATADVDAVRRIGPGSAMSSMRRESTPATRRW